MPRKRIRKAASRDAIAEATSGSATQKPSEAPRGRQSRIMYIERKAGALNGPARIGRVTFNRTGRTIYYRELVFRRIIGGGFKSNYVEEWSGEDYWISGCKRRGGDRLYVSNVPVEIDEDVRAEYWRDIRGQPERAKERRA